MMKRGRVGGAAVCDDGEGRSEWGWSAMIERGGVSGGWSAMMEMGGVSGAGK